MKNKKKKKRVKNAQYFSEQILSCQLLLAVIGGQKQQFKWWVQIRTSINLTLRICYKNIINVRLL